MSKIALITGATRGIGFETARQLAHQGVHVLLGARERGKGVDAALTLQAEGLAVEALQLDVTNSASIRAAADEVARRHGRLDILVNNAGVVSDARGGKPSAQTLSEWRRVFDTNLFGLVETTLAFLPLLHKSPAGRIVNLSSMLGSMTLHQQPDSPIYDFKSIPAYNVSKSAVNAWTVQLAWELRDTPIKVNAAHPGYVKTDMNAGAGEIGVVDGARTGVQLALLGADGPSGGFFHDGQSLPW
jgi:NAD(P)-dependent dehydrogenase (short-subunit alcohol dehydrogenase family)